MKIAESMGHHFSRGKKAGKEDSKVSYRAKTRTKGGARKKKRNDLLEYPKRERTGEGGGKRAGSVGGTPSTVLLTEGKK